MIYALFLAGVAALPPGPVSDEQPAGTDRDVPFPKPPIGLELTVAEGTDLLAPTEEWFEAQAELHPERFTYDDDLEGYVDAEGEYWFDEEEYVYWQRISAEQLTRGRQLYVQYCASCHGVDGQGYGRSGVALRPPPRNFTQGIFKFTKVPGEYLPSDDALVHLVKRGLNGTPMLPWDLTDNQLHDIITYVKSLSPEETGWRDPYNEVGQPIVAGDDPWEGRVDEAVVRGEEIYHSTARCFSCHPGYVTPDELNAYLGNPAGTDVREHLSYPALKDSSYEVLGETVWFMPPDFTWHEIRSGDTPAELFETLAAGIGGTAMPMWKDALPDEEIWAMAHYVRHLIDEYKGKPARATFMASLRAEQ